jgi:citrate lyase gamma subunit
MPVGTPCKEYGSGLHEFVAATLTKMNVTAIQFRIAAQGADAKTQRERGV